MKSLSIRTKLTGTFALLSLILLTVTALSLRAVHAEHEQLSGFLGGSLARITAAGQLMNAVNERSLVVHKLAAASGAGASTQQVDEAMAASSKVVRAMTDLTFATSNPAISRHEHELVDAIGRAGADYSTMQFRLTSDVMKGIQGEARAGSIAAEADASAKQASAIDTYASFLVEQARAQTAASNAQYERNMTTLELACLAAIGGVVVLALFLERVIVVRLRKATAAAKEMRELIDGIKAVSQGPLSPRPAEQRQ